MISSKKTKTKPTIALALAGGGPTPPGGTAFFPLSASARATHWFGPDPFAQRWIRPYAFVTGGYAMFDLKAQGHVREDPTALAHQGGINDQSDRHGLQAG